MFEFDKIAATIKSWIILLCVNATIALLSPTEVMAQNYSSRPIVGEVTLLKSFELAKGDAVLCYDDRPAFVFAPTGADGPNSIQIVPFDGNAKEIFSVSGKILAGTLSCSDDGQTIAFVRDKAESGDFDLFIIRSGTASQGGFTNEVQHVESC